MAVRADAAPRERKDRMMQYRTWRGRQWVARVEATLDGVNPPLRRVMEVDSTLSVYDFHTVLQVAFGWNDSHLHEFRPGHQHTDKPWPTNSPPIELVFTDTLDPERDDAWWVEAIDEQESTVGQLFAVGRGFATYVYDFGDYWIHSLTLVDATEPDNGTPQARVTAGQGASALDDVGGAAGLTDLFATLHDPTHRFHTEAWSEIKRLHPSQPLGYDLGTQSLSAGTQDLQEVNEVLLRMFGVILPEA